MISLSHYCLNNFASFCHFKITYHLYTGKFQISIFMIEIIISFSPKHFFIYICLCCMYIILYSDCYVQRISRIFKAVQIYKCSDTIDHLHTMYLCLSNLCYSKLNQRNKSAATYNNETQTHAFWSSFSLISGVDVYGFGSHDLIIELYRVGKTNRGSVIL